ncbi:hypothetical protein CC2G_000316 [Coprinopsis cinerea AmutBmut pab1-1]|nr:hypothetical protein CC2G_000316 [Coprinopsis cinerea AmutBmut pab1-1]
MSQWTSSQESSISSWGRPESPGPLDRRGPLLIEEEDIPESSLASATHDRDHAFYWWYGANAGGYVLAFGKNRGQRIRDVSIGYLDYSTREHADTCRCSLHVAIRNYEEGLWAWVVDHYEDFVIVFGEKFRERTLFQAYNHPGWDGWEQYMESPRRTWMRTHQGGERSSMNWVSTPTGGKYRFFWAAFDRFKNEPRSIHSMTRYSRQEIMRSLRSGIPLVEAQPPPSSTTRSDRDGGEDDDVLSSLVANLGNIQVHDLDRDSGSEAHTVTSTETERAARLNPADHAEEARRATPPPRNAQPDPLATPPRRKNPPLNEQQGIVSVPPIRRVLKRGEEPTASTSASAPNTPRRSPRISNPPAKSNKEGTPRPTLSGRTRRSGEQVPKQSVGNPKPQWRF